MGAVTSLAEAIRDPRITASIALDSMHTRMRYQIEARLAEAGHPSYPGNAGHLRRYSAPHRRRYRVDRRRG